MPTEKPAKQVSFNPDVDKQEYQKYESPLIKAIKAEDASAFETLDSMPYELIDIEEAIQATCQMQENNLFSDKTFYEKVSPKLQECYTKKSEKQKIEIIETFMDALERQTFSNQEIELEKESPSKQATELEYRTALNTIRNAALSGIQKNEEQKQEEETPSSPSPRLN